VKTRVADKTISIVPARPEQAEAISSLLTPYVKQGIVLPRPPNDVRDNIANFLVAVDGDRVVGSVAVRDFGHGLHEVRSLVVHPDAAGCGLGSRLVASAVALAEKRGATRVFALTMRPRLFERLHFVQVDKAMFPQKVWSDCIKCPKRFCCDEVAVMLDVARMHRRFG
jgi:amino-acid N-acetyltransferase